MPRQRSAPQTPIDQADQAVRRHLTRMKKLELVDFLLKLAYEDDALWASLEEAAGFEPAFATTAELVEAVRVAIDEATTGGDSGWGDFQKRKTASTI